MVDEETLANILEIIVDACAVLEAIPTEGDPDAVFEDCLASLQIVRSTLDVADIEELIACVAPHVDALAERLTEGSYDSADVPIIYSVVAEWCQSVKRFFEHMAAINDAADNDVANRAVNIPSELIQASQHLDVMPAGTSNLKNFATVFQLNRSKLGGAALTLDSKSERLGEHVDECTAVAREFNAECAMSFCLSLLDPDQLQMLIEQVGTGMEFLSMTQVLLDEITPDTDAELVHETLHEALSVLANGIDLGAAVADSLDFYNLSQMCDALQMQCTWMDDALNDKGESPVSDAIIKGLELSCLARANATFSVVVASAREAFDQNFKSCTGVSEPSDTSTARCSQPAVSQPNADKDSGDDFDTAWSVDDELLRCLRVCLELANDAKAQDDFTEATAAFYNAYTACVVETQFEATQRALHGLATLAEYLESQLEALTVGKVPLSAACIDVFRQWPIVVMNYLRSPADENVRIALSAQLTDVSLPMPLAEKEAIELVALLYMGEPQNLTVEAKPLVATEDDVALALPSDLSPRLLDVFLRESPDNASELGEILRAAEQVPEDIEEHLAQAQRLSHNIKGSANLVGVTGVATLAHNLEDLLEHFAREKTVPSKQAFDIMLDATDCLEAMFDSLISGTTPPSNALSILQSVMDLVNMMIAGGVDETDDVAAPLSSAKPPVSEPAVALSHVDESDGAAGAVVPSVTGLDEAALPHTAGSSADPESSTGLEENSTNSSVEGKTSDVRVSVAIIDELQRDVEEISLVLDQTQSRISSLRLLRSELRNVEDLIRRHRFDLENYIALRHVASSRGSAKAQTSGGDFDPLEMDRYDDLYSISVAFIEAVLDSLGLHHKSDAQVNELDKLLAPLKQRKEQMHGRLMQLRMVPLKTISSRLQRCVRQAARATNKDVTLTIMGDEQEIDSEILDKLTDPLMHILRNAVDHGIESAEVRAEKGKAKTGEITLRISQDKQDVLIECEDDGGGFDVERIREKAVERGLLGTGSHPATPEILRFILERGFSTRSAANQLSGRGIGMDVVNDMVRFVKGSIELANRPQKLGSGCVIALRMPLTLMTSYSLIVEINDALFAIPASKVERVLPGNMATLRQFGTEHAFEIEDQIFRVDALSNRLGLITANPVETSSPAVVVKLGADRRVLTVDRLVSNQNLVMKSLGKYIGNVRGISGVATYSDGRLVPVLDVGGLFEAHSSSAAAATRRKVTANTTSKLGEQPDKISVLIVDDSISVRQLLTELIGDLGYKPLVARDGIEAIDVLREHQPSIVLSDIEMPRMDGIELANYIRSNYGPELPIIMISSRSMQKHRDMAAKAGVNCYLTKPFSDDVLLSQMSKLLEVSS